MTDHNPMPALRKLSAALAKVAEDLGLRLVQFDCAQAFNKESEHGVPQEFFQAVFVLNEDAPPPTDSSVDFDAAFRDIEAGFAAEATVQDDNEIQAAMEEARRRLERLRADREPPMSD